MLRSVFHSIKSGVDLHVQASLLSFLLFFGGATILCGQAPQPQTPQTLPGLLARPSLAGGTLYRCLFDPAFDADADGWPDHWQRKRGIDADILFPDHLDISIQQSRNPFSNYVLRMNIQGGGAAVFSPKVAVRAGMSYTASVYVFAERLRFSKVSILLSFYGKNANKPLKSVTSETIQNTDGWRRFKIGPVIADLPDIQFVSVGFFVLPEIRNDFEGIVDFTNVEISESTTVSFTAGKDDHLFSQPRNIQISCRLDGIDPRQKSVDFVLEDPFGRALASREIELSIDNAPASQFVFKPEDDSKTYQGTAVWQNLPVVSPGFYRVRLQTPKSFPKQLNLPEGVFFDDPLDDAEPLNFAVLQPASPNKHGQFGWNLDGWSLGEIRGRSDLFAQAGISRLKIPAWLPQDADPGELQELVNLCSELTGRQFQLVGLLRPLPPEIVRQIKRGTPNAAALFSLPAGQWMSDLQAMLGPLALLIRDWQWTADDDLSLAELPGFVEQFEQFRKEFDANDYGFGAGLAWNWFRPLPRRFSAESETIDLEEISRNASQDTPQGMPQDIPPRSAERTFAAEDRISRRRAAREFVSLVPDESMTAENMDFYFQENRLENSLGNGLENGQGTGSPTGNRSLIRRFVSLRPLSEGDYSLRDRIADLVLRMVVARTGGAEALFLTQPIDRQTGVLRPDGTPTELFLPWRTTATMISGRDYLGSMTFPGRSRNRNFLAPGTEGRPDSVVTVLWNDLATPERPVLETLYLGEDVRVVDVWGKHHDADRQGREQVVSVERIPVFATGGDPDVFRFRQSFRLETRDIPSTPNRAYPISFSVTNTTDFALMIQVAVLAPRRDDWTMTRPEPLNLEPGQSGRSNFELTLNRSANTGLQPIRFLIRAAGLRPLEFTVYDDLQIGEKDLFMEFSTRLLHNGDIELFQAFVNNGPNVYSYECRLHVPGQMVRKYRLIRRGGGRHEHVYTISGGRELLRRGVTEITLRADPIGDGQPLFYSIPLLPQ